MIIYIYSASGVGSSTLGKILSRELNYRFVDIDDILFEKTQIPYTKRRSSSERKKLFEEVLKDNTVISGWFSDGIEEYTDSFDKVIFLTLDKDQRLKRIKNRELIKHGSRILEKGDMHKNFLDFIEWSEGYEEFDKTKRSYALHKDFFNKVKCDKLEIDNDDTYESFTSIMNFLKNNEN